MDTVFSRPSADLPNLMWTQFFFAWSGTAEILYGHSFCSQILYGHSFFAWGTHCMDSVRYSVLVRSHPYHPPSPKNVSYVGNDFPSTPVAPPRAATVAPSALPCWLPGGDPLPPSSASRASSREFTSLVGVRGDHLNPPRRRLPRRRRGGLFHRPRFRSRPTSSRDRAAVGGGEHTSTGLEHWSSSPLPPPPTFTC